MAAVKPFRAVRYDDGVAGPLERLVAPPYDVISPAEREELRARDPRNVVHLTLPDSEEEAARLWREWQAEGALVREQEPSFWALSQDYVGPDGVARTRAGLVVSLETEPYETKAVLPHERTHRGPRECRIRLLRAVGAQLEPIFLLYDGEPPVGTPDRPPDLEAGGTRLWRVADDLAPFFGDRQLLIADGHHRYESALAEGTPVLAVLVSTRDPGLMIFPTHRVFTSRPSAHWDGAATDAEVALRELDAVPADHSAFVQYDGRASLIDAGPARPLDVEVIDGLGHEGISYTPDWREAVQRVDSGAAAVAYLMRPTRIEDVFAVARGGEVLPQKTTYFYPKLLSGLLFHPV
ncbi:MAG: DUF1015 domain-containing protein [Actinomycetota bacterium]|nr:DUF1015 domain-containing protein [Actinomycetota bacterium]